MGRKAVMDRFRPEDLYEMLTVHHLDTRKELIKLFESEPELFRVRHDQPLRAQRELLMERWMRLHELGYFKNTITSLDPNRHLFRLATSEVCEMLDHSLSVKMGVHYGLFGSAVFGLGTEEQRKYWLKKAEDLDVVGCFALSELGAGSNVRGIRTHARYDRKRGAFVLNTPDDKAQKYWIGGAAETATHCVAFAQLEVDGEDRGIHAFVVQLRDKIAGVPVEGITLADCGHKWGLNGVDNGRIWFDNVIVPRGNMLCKLSKVEADGTFTATVTDPAERFGMTLAALTGGRVSIIFSGINQIKVGVTIAARYAKSREVFDTELMGIQTHQLRLFPYMCGAVVMNLVGNELKEAFYRKQVITKEMHVMSSGLKAMATWEMTKCLQECREACGGQGMLSENRVGPLVSEFNVAMTFEGDNHVLMQQVAKSATAQYAQGKKARKFTGPLEFLNSSTNVSAEKTDSMAFIISAMRQRLNLLLKDLTSSVGRFGRDPRDSVQDNLVLFEETGVAHTEQLVFENYARKLEAIRDDDMRQVLTTCGVLYGLYRIDIQPVFYRTGAVPSKKAAEVRNTLLKYVGRFGKSGMWEQILQSFAVPTCLSAPIAGDWVMHNARARL